MTCPNGNCPYAHSIRFVGIIGDKAIYQCDECKAIAIDANYLTEVQ